MLGSEGDVERSVITRLGTAWREFRVLMSLLTSRVLSLQVRGRLYEACVRSVMLYGSETWAVEFREQWPSGIKRWSVITG